MTAAEAAAELGYHDSRVRQLARKEKIRAVKIGRDWLFEPSALEDYKVWRQEQAAEQKGKKGRPFKIPTRRDHEPGDQP